MSTFIVEGGHRMHGDITPQGAKNEALQIICATLLTPERVVIENVPSSLTQKNIRKYFKVLTDDHWITCNGECIDYIYGYKRKKGKFTVRRKGMIEDYVASDHCPV